MADNKYPGKLQELSSESYPYGDVEEGFKPKTTPGPVAQGLSKALMQSAFQKFGEAFTDTGNVRRDQQTRDSRLAPYMQSGNAAAQALQGRWHTMEYDNFQTQFVEPFMDKKRAMLDDYNNRHAMADDGVFEGPDGNPMQLDLSKKEDRLKAVRMRGQLEKKFYQINGDMDLELFNEAGKYSSNPMIVERAMKIQATVSQQLSTVTNPQGTMAAEDKMSEMAYREGMMGIEAQKAASMAKANQMKVPARSLAEAAKHPMIGPGGLIQWLISDPNGISLLDSGGEAFIVEEKQKAFRHLQAADPDLIYGTPDAEEALERIKSQWIGNAAKRYLKKANPKLYAQEKKAAPHFFAEAEERERGVIEDKRMDPKVRKQKVDSWGKAAEDHFKAYMADPNNDPSFAAAMDDLDAWLRAAIYGDTDEPSLVGMTAARGEGTRKYVAEVLKSVPKHIRDWWASPEGSALAQELNPQEAELFKRAAGKGSRHSRRGARILLRERERKENAGIL